MFLCLRWTILPYTMAAEFDIMHGFGLPPGAVQRFEQDVILQKLYVCSCGHYLRARSHDTTRADGHEHDDILLYCISGRGWYRHLSDGGEMTAGDLVVLPREEFHGYGSSYEQPWSIYYAHYRGSALQRWYELMGLRAGQQLMNCTSLRRVHQLLEEMYQSYLSGVDDYSAVHAASCLSQVFSLLAQKQRSSARESTHMNLEAVHQFMHEHISEQISLNELADVAGLSVTHFSRRFSEQCGLSPIEYFIRLKMHQAAELLHHTDLSIASIAETLGYEDQYYFSRIFKKVYGQAPSKHRSLARLV